MRLFLFFLVTMTLCLSATQAADETVRALQGKLKQAGYYSGQLNGL
jgi:hypothetical protein